MSSMSGVGGMWGSYLALQDDARDDLYQPRYNWNYQMRSKEMAGGGQAQWVELWPTSKMCSGDPSVSLCMFGQDASEAGRFEAQSSISRGWVRPFFLRGICKDSNGNPLGGAVVYSFYTASNLLDGTAVCDDRGMFEVACQDTSAHFIDGYYASGLLAGRSVNTLIPVL